MLFFFKDGSYLVWNFLFDNILLAFFKGYAVFLAELYKKKPERLLSIYISLMAYIYFLI